MKLADLERRIGMVVGGGAYLSADETRAVVACIRAADELRSHLDLGALKHGLAYDLARGDLTALPKEARRG